MGWPHLGANGYMRPQQDEIVSLHLSYTFYRRDLRRDVSILFEMLIFHLERWTWTWTWTTVSMLCYSLFVVGQVQKMVYMLLCFQDLRLFCSYKVCLLAPTVGRSPTLPGTRRLEVFSFPSFILQQALAIANTYVGAPDQCRRELHNKTQYPNRPVVPPPVLSPSPTSRKSVFPSLI